MIETGVHFGDIHSFHDLNLVLAPFTYTPAQVKENRVDRAGGHGSIDLTEALGEVKYHDRELTFKFTVFPQDELTFEERQTAVSNAVNGLRCKITLDKDPDYYWEGRCKVNEYLSDKRLRQIVIVATVAPYKMAQHETVVPVELTGAPQTIILTNAKKAVVPVIECSDDDTVITFGNVEATLTAGAHKVLDIRLVQGANILTVSGSGTVTFTYREGVL